MTTNDLPIPPPPPPPRPPRSTCSWARDAALSSLSSFWANAASIRSCRIRNSSADKSCKRTQQSQMQEKVIFWASRSRTRAPHNTCGANASIVLLMGADRTGARFLMGTRHCGQSTAAAPLTERCDVIHASIHWNTPHTTHFKSKHSPQRMKDIGAQLPQSQQRTNSQNM